MANVNIKVGYTVDKTGLNEIKRELTNIQLEAAKAKMSGKLTDGLKEASKAASQLEDILNSAWNNKLNQLDLSKVNNGIKNTYGNVQNLQQALVKSGTMGASAYNNFAMQVLNTNNQLKQTSSTLDKMATTFKNTVRYGISSSVFNNFTNSIQKAYDYTVKLDSSLNDIRIVTGKSADEMDRFAVRANRVAKDLGRSTKDFTEASLIYYQQGLNDEESIARAEVTMKAANVTGQTGREVSEQLTAVWNGYKVTAEEAELYVDKLAAVAAGTAADLEELSTGMSKVASAANLMGVDIDQLNAQLATIVSVTRQAPESVGVALKTIYARMSDIKAGLDDEVTLGKYTAKMAQYGINVLDANNNLRDMGDVIEEIGEKWTSMSREQQVALSQVMAGTRQYNNLLSLFDNWDMYTESLKMSEQAVGTLQKQQDIYMESTKAHLQQLSTEAERTYDILFDQKAVNGMTDAMTGLLSIFNDLLAGLGGGANAFTFFGSTVANIFNKQIGASIERQIENLEAMRANVDKTQLQEQLILTHSARGESISEAGLEREIPYAEKTLELQKYLTAEQVKQFTNETAEIGLLEQKIKNITQYKDIAEKYGIQMKEDAALNQEALEDELAIQSKKQEQEIENYNILKSSVAEYQEEVLKENTNADYLLEKQLAILDVTEKIKLSKEEQQKLDAITDKVAEGEETLAEEEVQFILEKQRNIRNEINTEVNELKIAIQGAADEESSILADLQNEQILREKNLQTMQAQAERQKAISEAVKGVTALVSLFTTLSGVVSTVFNENLSGWEKFKRITTTLLATLPILVTSFSAMTKIMPNLAISMGAVAAGTKATDLSFKSATVSVLTFETALGPLYLVLLGIAAITATLVVTGVALYKAYNADADSAKRAAENAAELTKQYEELKNKAEELKKTISDYEDGKKALEELKQGTEEYNKALEKANATAKELMETYNLYDKAEYKNGLLVFSEGTLESLQGQINANAQSAKKRMYGAKIQANQANIKSQITDTARLFNAPPSSLGGSSLGGYLVSRQLSGSLFNNEVRDLVSALQNLKTSDSIQYEKIRSNNAAMEEWIKTSYKGNSMMLSLTDQIVKNKNALIDLADSTTKAAEANKRYFSEINKIEVEKKYGDQIAAMATNAKTGVIDQGLYQQILDIVNSSKVQQEITEKEALAEIARNARSANLKGDKYTSPDAWRHEFSQGAASVLTTIGTYATIPGFIASKATGKSPAESNINKILIDKLKDVNISEDYLVERLGRSSLNNDRDLAEAYAYLTGIDVSGKTWRKGKFLSDTGETLLDASNADARANMRAQIYSTLTRDFENAAIQAEAETDTQSFLDTFNQARVDAAKAGQQYGTDFSQALTNAISSKTHEFDFSSIFNRLSPTEAKKLQNLDIEGFKNLFGLTDEKIEQLGLGTAETLYNSYQSAMSKYEWDIDSAIAGSMELKKSDIEEYGSDLTKKKFAQYEEDIKIYAKNLMEIADSAEDVSDSLKEDSDTAVDFALKVIKMNKAIKSLADNMEDWTDIINNSAQSSQEYAEAMYNLKDALADVYDTEMDYISHSFIKEHLKEIQEIANGSEDAIEGLRDSLSEEIVTNIIVKNNLEDKKDELLSTFVSLREQAQAAMSGLVIGDDITVDDTNFVIALNQLIDDCQMTVEQANAVFSALGIEPTYETDTVLQKQKITPTQTEHKVIAASTKRFESSDGQVTEVPEYTAIDTVTPLTPVETDVEVPVMAMAVNGKQPHISGIKKAPGGSFNNYSSQNKGGGSPGKSGKSGGGGGGSKGSSKQPNKMDPLEKEINRYHDVDIQLKNIQTDLDKLDKQRKKLFGQDLISNLNKRLDLLNKQIEKTTKKIDIAKEEALELKNKLSGKGVTFNVDGTIANYAQVYASQLNYVNNLINEYNNMSAEAQEKYKDTVEQAKKDFDEFTKNIDRYDEVITSLIPGLEADIQEAIDEKIDLQIEKFDMEIEIRLNLAEAERDWNDFKKKIIDGIEDDDILGNAMAKLVDFSSYYKEDDTGIVQALRKQVNNTLDELNQMDTNGWSNVYGDNRTAALEDLKKYYEELMTNLEDVLDLQKEIHEAYIDMMDEAQDKFDEQVESYEMISDLIDHDMKVISLVYGEESYSQLARYYDKQQKNFNSQLDFQRQQVDFWRQQLDTLDESSKEWENAKEKWANAVKDLNDLIEKSIQNLQDKYLNAINLIFQNLNNKVTDGLGLDYVEEEWTLINKNADQYLDTINSLYGIQKLESKYLDALDQTDSISAQRQLKKIMDEELADLRERDKLTEYDIERANKKYDIALKQIALQEAQQNKTKMRLRRDSQGNYRYEYTSDADQVGQIQDELNDMYNSLYNFDKARYQDNLDQIYSVWAEFQEKMAEAAQINDPELRAEKELLLQTQYGELINGLVEQNATIRNNLTESAFDDLAILYETDASNFQNMSDQEKEIIMGDLLPYWESGVQHMTDVFAGEGGFLEVCQQSFEQLHEATKDYEDGLSELEETGRVNFESLGEGIDENIDRTQELIRNNDDLIDAYEDELTAIGNVIDQLDELVGKYNSAKNAAIAATKAAYEYWSQQQRQAAAAASKENAKSNGGSQSTNSGSGSSSGSGSNKGSGSGSGSGDGNLVLGETATFNGKYYYDSYGTTPAGSLYSGVANGIVVDIINGNPYGIHIHSADGKYRDLGWIKKSQLSRYDTGGYTGTWGSEGRLALLDEKELVLKKEDTVNMLNAVNIIRNITGLLGSSVLGKLAAATAGNVNTTTGNDILEQNVHIDAQFPNVKDSREIEEALNNLVNMASMRANKRK